MKLLLVFLFLYAVSQIICECGVQLRYGELLWSDEFSDQKLDSNNWKPEIGGFFISQTFFVISLLLLLCSFIVEVKPLYLR